MLVKLTSDMDDGKLEGSSGKHCLHRWVTFYTLTLVGKASFYLPQPLVLAVACAAAKVYLFFAPYDQLAYLCSLLATLYSYLNFTELIFDICFTVWMHAAEVMTCHSHLFYSRLSKKNLHLCRIYLRQCVESVKFDQKLGAG